MPRNRREVDRDTKVDEILDAAEQLLLDGGLEALSMTGVARQVGVAHNAVYWYFPTRDELFVAALERILRRALTAGKKPPLGDDPAARALWFVDRLGELESLLGALHDRARFSPAVAAFRDRLRGELRAMFVGGITPTVAPAERALTADAFIAAAEGALVQGLEPKKRRRLLRFTLTKLLNQNGPGGPQ